MTKDSKKLGQFTLRYKVLNVILLAFVVDAVGCIRKILPSHQKASIEHVNHFSRDNK